MQKDQVDQGLSFKKRARRRLVGAIALVLIMIIILPMMLEDRQKTVQEDIEIVMSPKLPNSDTTVELDVESLADVEEVMIQEPDSESSVNTAVVELPDVDVQPTIPEPALAEKSESNKPVKASEDVAKASPSKVAGYYVQIGVFSNPDNIKKLQLKLNDLGYRSLTEKISTDTGIKTRLRTESFDERNEAAIALQNIKDAGLAGMVVSQK
jgi:DedD protein